MQQDIYYFKIIPKKIVIHKSIAYSVHPLTKFRILLFRNSEMYDSMKNTVYAGNHNGIVAIESVPLSMVVDIKARTNFFSIKLIQIKYSLFKNESSGTINVQTQKQELVGSHNLFIKNYILKFKVQNIHSFEQQAQVSADFVMHYEVFIEKTLEGLDQIVFQHERLVGQNRVRKISQIQSVKSSTFSDKINKIQVKGQNRFAQHASQLMQRPLVGSQSKLNMTNFVALNLKKGKIRRSNQQSIPKARFYNYNAPSTQRKQRQASGFNENNDRDQGKEQLQNQEQEQILSPPILQPLQMKKLTSQEVKVNFQFFSPQKIIKKTPRTKNDIQFKEQTKSQKRRKLLQEFEQKRIEFKRKLNETKHLGIDAPLPLTDRKLKRSNSSRSMKSVRLSELQKLPEQKPWIKKEKQKAKQRNRKLWYFLIGFLIFLLYVAMLPNRNYQLHKNKQKADNMAHFKFKSERNNNQKKSRAYKEKK